MSIKESDLDQTTKLLNFVKLGYSVCIRLPNKILDDILNYYINNLDSSESYTSLKSDLEGYYLSISEFNLVYNEERKYHLVVKKVFIEDKPTGSSSTYVPNERTFYYILLDDISQKVFINILYNLIVKNAVFFINKEDYKTGETSRSFCKSMLKPLLKLN